MENKTLCHEAIVKKVDDDKVTVQMHVESACATCHTRHLCGMSESKLEELVIHNFYHDHFEIGEKVQVRVICVNLKKKEITFKLLRKVKE